MRLTSSRKKKVIIVCAICILLLVIVFSGGYFYSWQTYNENCSLMSSGREPEHIWGVTAFNDGGTKIHSGLGYQIIKWHRIDVISGDLCTKYICGWEMHWGYNAEDIVNIGPNLDSINDFHYEFGGKL